MPLLLNRNNNLSEDIYTLTFSSLVFMGLEGKIQDGEGVFGPLIRLILGRNDVYCQSCDNPLPEGGMVSKEGAVYCRSNGRDRPCYHGISLDSLHFYDERRIREKISDGELTQYQKREEAA